MFLKKNLSLIFIFCLLCSVSSANESSIYINNANKFYQNYLVTKNNELLDKAYLNYYKASEITPSSSSYLGMGMVFIEKKLYSRAKKYLYKAYSLDENDATTNYYLAKYSYQNEDYLKALEFYKKAYANGLSGNYDVNLKLGAIYEKVGDISKSRVFYQSALALNPNSQEAKARLIELDNLECGKNRYFSVSK